MIQVIVYLSSDYNTAKSIYVSGDLSKEEITQKVNERFGKGCWFSYDII